MPGPDTYKPNGLSILCAPSGRKQPSRQVRRVLRSPTFQTHGTTSCKEKGVDTFFVLFQIYYVRPLLLLTKQKQQVAAFPTILPRGTKKGQREKENKQHRGLTFPFSRPRVRYAARRRGFTAVPVIHGRLHKNYAQGKVLIILGVHTQRICSSLYHTEQLPGQSSCRGASRVWLKSEAASPAIRRNTYEVQAFRQTIGVFVYHDLRKSNDVVIILVQGRWSHRPPLMYRETEQ